MAIPSVTCNCPGCDNEVELFNLREITGKVHISKKKACEILPESVSNTSSFNNAFPS